MTMPTIVTSAEKPEKPEKPAKSKKTNTAKKIYKAMHQQRQIMLTRDDLAVLFDRVPELARWITQEAAKEAKTTVAPRLPHLAMCTAMDWETFKLSLRDMYGSPRRGGRPKLPTRSTPDVSAADCDRQALE
jgi:hypothetical protein